jgi:hypothetical protein
MFLITKKFSQFASKSSLIYQSLDWMFSMFLDEYLNRPYIGQSKNKKLLPVHIGALIRNFHFSKKMLSFLSLNGQIL